MSRDGANEIREGTENRNTIRIVFVLFRFRLLLLDSVVCCFNYSTIIIYALILIVNNLLTITTYYDFLLWRMIMKCVMYHYKCSTPSVATIKS